MGTSEAVYTIAFDEGLDISAYLPAEETEAVRRLVAQLRSATPVAPGLVPARGRTKDSKPKPALVTIAGVKVEKLPGMSATTAQEAKTMAEKVYPALYVFENSAREVIAKILEGQFGSQWWEKSVPKKVREAAQTRKDGESADPWHGSRGASMIDYTLLSELPKIVASQTAWPHSSQSSDVAPGLRSW